MAIKRRLKQLGIMAKIKVQERQMTIINHKDNDYISRVFRHLGKLYNPCFNSLEFEGFRKRDGIKCLYHKTWLSSLPAGLNLWGNVRNFPDVILRQNCLKKCLFTAFCLGFPLVSCQYPLSILCKSWRMLRENACFDAVLGGNALKGGVIIFCCFVVLLFCCF